MNYDSYYFFLFACFCIVVYLIYVDKNVADFIILLCRASRVWVSRLYYMATMYPRLRYETFLLKRSMHKISKKHLDMANDLIKELEKNERSGME
jgi:hypothetical protein